MAKEEWGLKHLCENCETKFYDLQRDPIVCPSCGTRVVRPGTDGEDSSDGDVNGGKADKRDKLSRDIADDGDMLDSDAESNVDIDDDVLEDDDEDTVPPRRHRERRHRR